MNDKLATAKKFVARHKVAIAITGTTLTCLTINHLAMKSHNNFLKEHDLYDLFYALNGEGE